ncbi:23S rRNA (guanosine(2251)-2'-O)-methyltransferase RlmB [Salinicoccus halodurans]|uniref:Putative TrmH family tRNA/rRNA methyltransferase n=1 Tax=Salinicoccus halodurans TaxID=407035 RepID=A0A0F7HN93_9STAP|nr:23S rRNA (guanosine(2251)-2'-O)-methyltransferase RlmB [Salinicoccus halodurans]AKG75093.1 RNA methyltransferase [Salinicoccus halodurans]SFK65672.1 23S rRNA (guanosine2251-2'-O)-methyltransferase [Salinicoccus halodurans]
MSDSVIAGRHAVKEALQSGADINKVMIQDSINKGQVREILDIAKKRKIVVQAVPKNKIDGLTDERHQGVIALASPHEYMPLERLLENIEGRRANVVILDGLEDPHNLGSILRTCDATGFDGVIIPNRRSVQLTDTVAKTSTGAIEHVPVVRVTNINQTIDTLKEKGFWIAGSDGKGKMDYRELAADVNTALVIGSEGKGISRKTLEKCDFIVRIPMVGHITSLNASVSAALLMYEVYRRQNPAGSE